MAIAASLVPRILQPVVPEVQDEAAKIVHERFETFSVDYFEIKKYIVHYSNEMPPSYSNFIEFP
jgi:hypothetical protein